MRHCKEKQIIDYCRGAAALLIFFFLTMTVEIARASDISACDLEIKKSVDKREANDGDFLVYTIKFKNISDRDCKEGVKIQDIADPQLVFQRESHTSNVNAGYNGSTPYNPNSRMVKWHATFLPRGAQGTVSWTAEIIADLDDCESAEILNKARIGAIRGDDEDNWLWTESNIVSTKVAKDCECRLSISKIVNMETADNADVLTYTLDFKNIGDGECTGGGVRIEDVLDSRLEFINEAHSSNVSAGYGNIAVYQDSDRTLRWNAQDLLPDEWGWVSWNARAKDATCSPYNVSNKARISAAELDWEWVWSNTVFTKLIRNNCGELNGSCIARPASGEIGDEFTFVANASGGSGIFSYSWTGSEGLSALGREVNKIYNTDGIKNASVTITSGNDIVSRACAVEVKEKSRIDKPQVRAFCDGLESSFEVFWMDSFRSRQGHHIGIDNDNNWSNGGWFKTAGSGQTNIRGPQGFSPWGETTGSLVLRAGATYQVRIYYLKTDEYSETVSFTASSCGGGLNAVCKVSPGTGDANTIFTWEADATGGTGAYTYSWTGTDGLIGSDRTARKVYPVLGQKTATVTVKSGNETVSRTCVMTMIHPPCGNCPGAGGLDQPNVKLVSTQITSQPLAGYIFLSQVPYTGIESDVILYSTMAAFWSIFIFASMYLRMVKKHRALALAREGAKGDEYLEEWIESYARSHNVLVSIGGIQRIIELAHGNVSRVEKIILTTIRNSRAENSNEWVTLDELSINRSEEEVN